MKLTTLPTHAIADWFNQYKRDLPWRNNPTPYRVWVSEIMLQQTQVSVVIPYFEKWMERFPTIEALAQSREEEVMKVWEGLGYYSRARSLRKGAIVICDQFGGEFPSNREQIEEIPGIGPYTSGAIMCFAFGGAEDAIDGNVFRVLSRLMAMSFPMSSTKEIRLLRGWLKEQLEGQDGPAVMEGLIELGALVCKRVALCSRCPIADRCLAFKRGAVQKYPIKKARPKVKLLYRSVYILQAKSKVLLYREENKLMQGLWHFPYFEKGIDGLKVLGIDGIKVGDLEAVEHSFTRYRSILQPVHYQVEEKPLGSQYQWVEIEELDHYPFPSGHRQIKSVMSESYGREFHCQD